MSEQEVATIFHLLKEHLKAKGLSYKDIASKMRMSESNVKRIFSTKSCSLLQAVELCSAAEISFNDLVTIANKSKSPEYILPATSESYFMENFGCFIFYRNLFGAQDKEKFLAQSELSKAKKASYLAALEKLGLIKMGKRGLTMTSTGYLRLTRTPKLARYVNEQWAPWFLERTIANHSDQRYSLRTFSTGLSRIHRAQLQEDLEQLVLKYKDIGFRDQQMGAQEYDSVGVCIAIGPHRLGFFESQSVP